MRKVAGKKILGEALLEHIRAYSAAVQRDDRPSDSGSRNTGRAEQLTSEFFVTVARILNRVVEMNPAQSVELPTGTEVFEVNGPGRLVIHRSETADRTFQMHRNVCV